MKIGRQAKILELIGRYDIDTQEELCRKLNEEGYEVTQATVSRDIRALKLIKVSDPGGKSAYRQVSGGEDHAEKYAAILKNGFVSADMAQNILVIKTVAGMAMAVAAAIDALDYKEIVGCIAGDDTIMAAVRTAESCEEVMRKIRAMVEK